jgi:hypothetical protein
MDVHAIGIAEQPIPEVADGGDDPRPPSVHRVNQAIQAPRLCGGSPDEGTRVGVAADHAVEGDDVGRLNLSGELGEVAMEVAGLSAPAKLVGLGLGGGEVGRRGIHVE